jgi:P27 family predicted phage terminase small subunit
MSDQEITSKKETTVPVDLAKAADAKALLTVECPAELGPVAREEWDRLVRELNAQGIVTNLDRGPLAIYCAAYELWVEALDSIQKYGTMMKSPSGYPVQSPYVAVANRQVEIMLRIACEFGFTPASRARISRPSDSGPFLEGPTLSEILS